MTTAADFDPALEPDFGLDVSCVYDLDPTGREVNGYEALAQALLRRLDCEREDLVDDADYGYPLTNLLSHGMTRDELAAVPDRVAAELEKDERVERAIVKALRLTTNEITLEIRIVTRRGGSFRFTSAINGVAALILGDVLPEAA